jgi:hypothetical protein
VDCSLPNLYPSTKLLVTIDPLDVLMLPTVKNCTIVRVAQETGAV